MKGLMVDLHLQMNNGLIKNNYNSKSISDRIISK